MVTPAFNLTATERVLPKLALDFTVASLDNRITFVRSGATATRVNASGLIEIVSADTPRFDYDPVTGLCKGLLIEETRTNHLLNSEDFTAWNGGFRATSNTIESPSGDITADTFTTTIDGDSLAQNITQTGDRVFSIFAQKGSVDKLRLRIDAATDFDGYFDLTTGVCDTANSAAGSAIVDYGDGWYRCIVPGNITTPVKVALYTQSIATGYVNGTVYLWGAQFE